VSVQENMWNKTGGLCGNLNDATSDDFVTKFGQRARSLEAFLDSWTTENAAEKKCDVAPLVSSPCTDKASEKSNYCHLIRDDPHFAACREVCDRHTFLFSNRHFMDLQTKVG